jgi:hypothetical protein
MAAAAAGMSALLGGCSGSLMADHLPAAAGGLPEGAPVRPTTEQAYPAVHNVPPSRNSPPLSDDQQKQLADELEAARNRANQDAPATTGSTTNSQTGSARNQ